MSLFVGVGQLRRPLSLLNARSREMARTSETQVGYRTAERITSCYADWPDETLIANVVADVSKRHGLHQQFYT